MPHCCARCRSPSPTGWCCCSPPGPRRGAGWNLRWSRPLIETLTASVSSYQALASYTPSLVSLSGGSGDPEQIDAEIVSPDYFGLMRVPPAIGRTFTAAEDGAAGDAPVVVLSDMLWRRRYGGDPSIIGGPVRVNDVALTIVGVMPSGFRGLSGKAEVWLPRMMAPLLTYSEYLTTPQHFIMVVARLQDDVSFEAANAELAAVGEQLGDPPSGDAAQWSAMARPLGEARVDVVARRSTLALLGAAACVLLIACVNVASLLLARARTRQREIAVRLAIGSSARESSVNWRPRA